MGSPLYADPRLLNILALLEKNPYRFENSLLSSNILSSKRENKDSTTINEQSKLPPFNGKYNVPLLPTLSIRRYSNDIDIIRLFSRRHLSSARALLAYNIFMFKEKSLNYKKCNLVLRHNGNTTFITKSFGFNIFSPPDFGFFKIMPFPGMLVPCLSHITYRYPSCAFEKLKISQFGGFLPGVYDARSWPLIQELTCRKLYFHIRLRRVFSFFNRFLHP